MATGVRSTAMRRCLGAAAIVVACCLAIRAQDRGVTLWVTLGDSDQLVEVDAYTFKEVRRITTDPRPHGLATSSDGSKVYIGSDRTGNLHSGFHRIGPGQRHAGRHGGGRRDIRAGTGLARRAPR